MSIPIVNRLDKQIVGDSRFNQRFRDEFISAQRDLGLVFGDRPTCPFLRPHIVPRERYDAIKSAAELIATAVETVVENALTDPSLMKVLGPTADEEVVARLDPGYKRLCVTSRLDSYVTATHCKFLEYNAETPAGVGDQMQLEKLLFELPNMKEFLAANQHWSPQPHNKLLQSLLSTYGDWGGKKEWPQIAIVDWKGVSTEQEFRVLQGFFEDAGYETRIVDPSELTYDGESLRVGNFIIDILYKRVVIHEFLGRFGLNHALVDAYRDKRVCMVNSFRTKLAHKKASLAVLSDPDYRALFSDDERETIRRHIPWTRVVAPRRTTYRDDEYDLLSLITNEREHFVLKPNDDYGGHGVFLGWETDASDWARSVDAALERPYVVQERVPAEKVVMPTFAKNVALEEMFVDFNPFLFENKVEGALVRLSTSPIVNVTAGGGQSALLVLEE